MIETIRINIEMKNTLIPEMKKRIIKNKRYMRFK